MQVLKPFQIEALASLRSNAHTLLIAPTGSGKSLVFQRYVQETRKRAVLICPLNALARQHEAGFRRLGVPVSLGVGPAGAGPPGRSGVWILNPEKIAGRFFRELRSWVPSLFIVDEAHCVFEWGESFRPEFARLPEWVDELQIPKSFWCTATLPWASTEKLRESLPGPLAVIGAFALPESLEFLTERIRPFERLDRLRELLQESHLESGMIFVNTRHASERVGAWLSAWGYRAVFYHAGMSLEERLALEAQLQKAQGLAQTVTNARPPGLWVVATSAFGMGMDYPFLSRCYLLEPSFSLLAMAQALGRVGRTGKAAKAVMLWHEDDFARNAWVSEGSPGPQKALQEVRDWCLESGCPRKNLERYFKAPADFQSLS